MDEQKTFIEIPVNYVIDQDGICLFGTEETDNILGTKIGIVVQESTLQEAKDMYLSILKYHLTYLEERSKKLDNWMLFQKGDWSHIGGKWFTIYGFHFYFRYGKGMKHGWYIPFTKLNISITNCWKVKRN
jgi:hypothetical protein